ncbi:MAG: hypothetical protein JWQ71_3813 [Pedosphaera sp.]|nr:hypothetical protein [Pedosphaera sp.]
MGPLKIKSGPGPKGRTGVWVEFDVDGQATFVPREDWVGVDLDGTLSSTDNPGHFEPPYPLGEPVLAMLEMVKSLLVAGVTVKIFSARACEPENIPIIQDWAVKHGLGKLEVTNQKDFNLIRFYDDRAIQICPNRGVSVAAVMGGAKLFQESAQQFYQRPSA